MKRKRVLAVASSGGHWVELKRILPALAGAEVVFASVEKTYAAEVPGYRFHWIYDAHRKDKVLTAKAIARLAMIIALVRPDVIVTTGSGPGMLAVRLGKLFGARTVWIES